MKLRSRQGSRWGLLIITVALAGVLVVTGIVGYVGAKSSSEAVIQARAVDLAMSIRRTLVLSLPGERLESIQALIVDMEDQGLRYVAVANRDGTVVASAGQPIEEAGIETSFRPRQQEPVRITHHEGRVRAVCGLRRPGRPGQRLANRRWANKWGRGKGQGWAFKASPTDPPGSGPQVKRPGGGRAGIGQLLLIVEFEPVVASAITSRALVMLVVSVAAAILLLAAAAVFWRLSKRAEEMQEVLARDQQLKALGQMSAVLGHEIRNPLASLKGHAQLLLERLDEDHPGRRGAERVVKEAVRLEELTTQILDFVRSGKLDAKPQDPVALARATANGPGLEQVNLIVDGDIPRWHLDMARMERALANLVRNAAQASKDGEPVDFTVATRHGSELIFTVRDRGEGIAPGDEEWIFEPFHTRKTKGTGLGLAVAKRVVEAHGGRLTAGNHPKGGAVFQVILPKAGSSKEA